MDRVEFLDFTLLIRDISRLDRYSTQQIHQHLKALIDAGIVEVVEIPAGERTKGQPNKFYGITETAREIFDRNNVFIEEHWQDIYERVDKPSEIEQAEAASRPEQ